MPLNFLLSYLKYLGKNPDLASRSQHSNTILVIITIPKISLLMKNFTFDVEPPHVRK